MSKASHGKGISLVYLAVILISAYRETRSEITGWQEKLEGWSILVKNSLPWVQNVVKDIQRHQGLHSFLTREVQRQMASLTNKTRS